MKPSKSALRKPDDRQILRVKRSLNMVISKARRIVVADRMNDGIIIKFDDGKCAFYSCELLYVNLSKCEELDETVLHW